MGRWKMVIQSPIIISLTSSAMFTWAVHGQVGQSWINELVPTVLQFGISLTLQYPNTQHLEP